ncbi:MAG: hypothetical protein U5L08_04950 [Xanthomonadales bacterium]|nr:hypothetical protein [Xanthomonadales bacterium]
MLDHLASFSLEGADARVFAQSQFTVSIDTLSRDCWKPLAWCEPKGRVVSFMMSRSSENGVDLVLPASQADDVTRRLAQFTIGRSVEITPLAPVAGCFNPGDDMPGLAPDADRGMIAGTEAPADADSQRRWQALDICQGLPWLEPPSSGQHLPQWLGLERLGALAYDKGCYPGQEVIARLHYRGSVKHRLAGLRLNSNPGVAAHARVTDEQGAGVGHWLSGLAHAGVTIGLAVVSTRIHNGDTVLLNDGDHGTSAKVTPPETLC